MASMFVTTPLIAQPYGGSAPARDWNRGWSSDAFWRGAPSDPWERIQFLQTRIDRGIRDGSLDRGEGRRAARDLRQIRNDFWRMRRSNGHLSGRENANLQMRLDELSRNIRWARRNDSWYSGGYVGGPGRNRWSTDYDASRYYRDSATYQERRLRDTDEVYRGSDGRYYCKRSDGTTGLIVGAAAGGILGNLIDGGSNRVAGTLVGGTLGAIAGRSIERDTDIRCR
jgi:hypothetical protein